MHGTLGPNGGRLVANERPEVLKVVADLAQAIKDEDWRAIQEECLHYLQLKWHYYLKPKFRQGHGK